MVTLDSSVTLYCISNLREKSSLFFRVSAENPIGAGAPADTDLVSLKTHASESAGVSVQRESLAKSGRYHVAVCGFAACHRVVTTYVK